MLDRGTGRRLDALERQNGGSPLGADTDEGVTRYLTPAQAELVTQILYDFGGHELVALVVEAQTDESAWEAVPPEGFTALHVAEVATRPASLPGCACAACESYRRGATP